VVLVTSFSLEELDYLRSLPERTWPSGTSIADQVDVVRQGWGRPEIGVWLNPLWSQCNEHDAWGHNHDGWAYYRHGDMLAKMPCPDASSIMPAADQAALTEWLQSLHAHEAAVR
jgi:hypothetical protein